MPPISTSPYAELRAARVAFTNFNCQVAQFVSYREDAMLLHPAELTTTWP
jgi:hypothetical protein